MRWGNRWSGGTCSGQQRGGSSSISGSGHHPAARSCSLEELEEQAILQCERRKDSSRKVRWQLMLSRTCWP